MKKLLPFTCFACLYFSCCLGIQQQSSANPVPEYKTEAIQFDSTQLAFPWLDTYKTADKLVNSIPLPACYERTKGNSHSFAYWLSQLPINKRDPNVHLYNGSLKSNQGAQFAILDIDVGQEDLQQCADAVIRLRAEYLYHTGQYDKIQFKYTSGDLASWYSWRSGKRPIISGNSVSWQQKYGADDSYLNFKNYLRNIFMYCGTLSLSKELFSRASIHGIEAGDVFIKGGSPGHAEIVIDVAVNKKTGKKIFMLAQSYMPAQQIHILKNPNNTDLSPWYEEDFGDILNTPEYRFERNSLMSFSK